MTVSTEVIRKNVWIMKFGCKLYMITQNCFPVSDLPLSVFWWNIHLFQLQGSQEDPCTHGQTSR